MADIQPQFDNNNQINVYGKPNCVQCDRTVKILQDSSTPFNYFDVTEDLGAHRFITNLGYKQAPVVVVGPRESMVKKMGALTVVESWSGLDPDRIKAAIAKEQDRVQAA